MYELFNDLRERVTARSSTLPIDPTLEEVHEEPSTDFLKSFLSFRDSAFRSETGKKFLHFSSLGNGGKEATWV